MDGQNYLVFHTAADDSYMNSTANFRGCDVTGNTEVTMYFAAVDNRSGSHDSVKLTITAGTEVAVVEALAAACAGAKNPVTVIADDINSVYIHESVTACGDISVQGGNYLPIVTWSAATTLYSYNSGATVVTGDTTAGILTLPTPVSNAGWYVDVFIANAQASAATHINTPAGFFVGMVTVDDLTGTAGESVVYVSDNDSNDWINLDATTKGNAVGGKIRIISDGTNYLVNGSLVGDGTLNTNPFADAES
jgi:hypothetical protein